MPTAIISESRRASDQVAIPRTRAFSPTVIAPGPNGRAGFAAWRAIQRNGMKADFSWTNSGRAYAELYRELTGKQ